MGRQYKLLIADDDAIIRRGLSQLIDWKENHFDVAAYVQDGEKAWEIIQSQSIDILISDIKMPFMDGIQLLERIHEKYPQIRTILLTGYEDFEYARQAIKHKAFDFLLKPVDHCQLLETVKRAAYSLEEMQIIQENIDENMETKRKNFYCKLLQGTMTSQEAYRQASILEVPLYQNGLSLVFTIVMDICVSEEEMQEEIIKRKEELVSVVLSSVKSFANKEGNRLKLVVCDYKRNELDVLATTDELSEKEWGIKMYSFAEGLLIEIEKNCGTTVTIGMGTIQPELTGLHTSYAVAGKALKNRHICGKNQVIDGSSVIEPMDNVREVMLPSDRLLQHIRLGFQEDVSRDIESVFEELCRNRYISLESARMISTELAIVCFKGQTVSGEGAVSYLYFLNEIQKITTIEELKQKVLELAVQIASQRGNRQTTQRQLALDALEYMNAHFSEETLSLGDLANQFHVSQTYMSIVLKQETETNFSAHLLNLRMKKAMELLRSSDVKHYEVADQVGYSNSQYFAVCFKKYTGMTPTQFREQ